MEIKTVEERLKTVLQQVLRDANPGNIDADVALVKKGLSLDSVALLEFVVTIEHEFGIVLDDSLLTIEHFESLHTLAELVHRELGNTPEAKQESVG